MAQRAQPKCGVCGDPVYAKGLCVKHYHRARRNKDGDPGEPASRLQGRLTIKMRVAPTVDAWLRKRADRTGVSISRLCEMLIQRGIKASR